MMKVNQIRKKFRRKIKKKIKGLNYKKKYQQERNN